MGSRLKGSKRKEVNQLMEWRIHKLIVYGVLVLGFLALFIYLYMKSLEPERSTPPADAKESADP